jgi:hypothetical protein
MGQKVNPIGLRLGINRTWDSRWYAGKAEYGKLLHEDMQIREELMKDLKQAAVSKIVIERPAQEVPRHRAVGAAGRGDRQEGRRHREAAQEGRQPHRSPTSSSTSSRSGSPSSTPSWSPNRSPSSSSAASRSAAP